MYARVALNFVCVRYTTSIPSLFLEYEMWFHKELDSKPESAGSQIVHLLADSVPQVEPQVLSLTARELQAKVVHLYDSQLPTHLWNKRGRSQLWRRRKINVKTKVKPKVHNRSLCRPRSLRSIFKKIWDSLACFFIIIFAFAIHQYQGSKAGWSS